MLRTLMVVLCLAVALGSCSSRNKTPPRNLDNACSILKQRSGFKSAFIRSERKWGVPVHVQMAIMHQESKFVSNAKTRRKYLFGIIPRGRQSSAYGYAQVLDGTWDEYKRKTGRRLARRSNIRDAADFIGYYADISRRRNGVSLYDARGQYLNYHEGHGGYARGTYRKKAWLLAVADKVAARAAQYQGQLRRCL